MGDISSIELLILDFRYFIDESLTFLEFFESGERDSSRKFSTNRQEIAKLRQYTIEFTRLLYDLKNSLFTNKKISDFNLGLVFSKEFKQKRVFFFKTINSRLDNLYKRIFSFTADYNDLVKMYFKIMLKIARNTNEFIGFLESSRWNRDIAVKFIDNLIKLCNDFSSVNEEFILYLEKNHHIVLLNEPESQRAFGEKKDSFSKFNRLRVNATKSIDSLITSLSGQTITSKYTTFPTVLIIMVLLILFVIFLIALPIYRLVFSGFSETNTVMNKRTNYFSFYSGDNKAPFTEKEGDLIDWNFILSYLTNIYVIFFTLICFAINECLSF